MVRPRRALRGVRALPLARQMIIFATVPAVIVGATLAGLFILQQNQARPQTMSPGANPSQTASQRAQVAEAISACRRHVAVAESVLDAADNGIRNWRDRIEAQSDLALGRISKKEAEEVWKKTGQAGPSDIAKYQTAKDRFRDDSTACAAVKGAEDADNERLEACRTRAGKVRSALAAADRTMKDWEIALSVTPSEKELKPEPEGVWADAWKKAPKNLSAYSDAMDTLAKTKSCPR